MACSVRCSALVSASTLDEKNVKGGMRIREMSDGMRFREEIKRNESSVDIEGDVCPEKFMLN